MDPSRYARAFGVQSESNKATVTRVASNEIVYRRAVDTYRRDMSSTMTNIHREQKKLRRNMRTYRRRLRETHSLPAKKRKPFKVGWIAYDSETSFFDLPAHKNRNKTNTENTSDSNGTPQKTDVVESKQDAQSKLQAQVDVFLKSVDEHVHNMHIGKREIIDEDENSEFIYDKNGRRRFLFGSGGIGVTSDDLKYLEFDLEGYRVDHDDHLSDISSDDEEGGGGGGRKTTRNDSRKKRAMELLRLNSAYFTPIDLKDGDIDQPINGNDSENTQNGKEISSQTNGEENINTETDRNDKSAGKLPTIDSVSAAGLNSESDQTKGPPNLSKAISIVVQKIRDENEQEIVPIKTVTQTQAYELSSKRSSKVNFGDLIKFKHHGVNTKKLFSMVDQLASKYGISSKEDEHEPGNRRPQGSINMRPSPNLEPIHESSTKSSIFYAMKYGYGKNGGHPQKDEYRNDGASINSYHVDEHQNNAHPSNADRRMHREQRGSSNNRHLSPYQEDMVDGPMVNNHTDRKYELPFLQVSSPASLTRHSVDGKGPSRNENDATPLTTTQSMRSNENLVKNRRSSILDASDYVTNLRRRTNIQEHDRMFGIKSDADRFGPRRLPAALRKERISEHQRKADDNKIAWSSALGQMKLVHTLQDLTHFI